jgi:hypothetical protein
LLFILKSSVCMKRRLQGGTWGRGEIIGAKR